MPAIAVPLSVTMLTQLGKQSSWGTGVAANKYLAALSVKMRPSYEVETNRNAGEKVPYSATVMKQETVGEFEMPLCFNSLIYVLSSAMKGGVSPATVDTSGRTWTFAPSLTGPETVDTFTIENGASDRAGKCINGMFDDLTFTFGRAGLGVKGSVFGGAYTDGITMTAGPSTVASLIAQPAMGYMKTAATWAGLAGASEFALFFSAEVKLGKRFDKYWNTKTGQLDWGGVTEQAHEPEATVVVAADATGMAWLTNIANQTRTYLRFGYTASAANGGAGYLVGSSAAYAGVTMDLSGQVTNVEELGEGENGARIVKFKFNIVRDSANKLAEVVVTNALTAL